MRVIDLTHPICPGMPVYPGTEPPAFTEGNTLEKDGFRETRLTFFSHTGTHIDAPAHLLPTARTLDAYALAQFVGKAVVVDCTHLAPDEPITPAHLPEAAKEEGVKFLLFHTGHSRLWGKEAYFGNCPLPDADVLDFAIARRMQGVGIDAISIDPVSSTRLERHLRLLSSGLLIIENLCSLSLLPNAPFQLAALPLFWQGADGAPARVAAMIE